MRNKHYIRIDESGNIIKGFSDAFEQPGIGDTFLQEGGRQFCLFGVENPQMVNMDGTFVFSFIDGEVVKN